MLFHILIPKSVLEENKRETKSYDFIIFSARNLELLSWTQKEHPSILCVCVAQNPTRRSVTHVCHRKPIVHRRSPGELQKGPLT